jgi:integrase
MAKPPYLQRRGLGFTARIAVPRELRQIIGVRELTTALSSDKHLAMAQALRYAAETKELFSLARQMTDENKPLSPELKEIIREARERLRFQRLQDQHLDELIDLKKQHNAELKLARLAAANRALLSAQAAANIHSATAPQLTRVSAPAPRLSAVIDDFIASLQAKKKAMRDKHNTALPALLELLGDRPVNEILQKQLNDACDIIQRLPRNWKTLKNRTRKPLRVIARENNGEGLAHATFMGSWRASISPFLKWGRGTYKDQGFPDLTTDHIKYKADREPGEKKQRPFTDAELKQLFEGEAMRAFAASKTDAQRFWLLATALHTGARINELCQLNPQCDIGTDEHGNPYMHITSETEGDPEIDKSAKNKYSKRNVPMHPKLIALGLPAYCDAVKQSGAKRLFPVFPTDKGKAGGEAGEWFGKLLEQLGLRDETPGARLVGIHAFRHTMLSKGDELGLDLRPITGHSRGLGTAEGYIKEQAVSVKLASLERVTFDLDLPRPVTVMAGDISITHRKKRQPRSRNQQGAQPPAKRSPSCPRKNSS